MLNNFETAGFYFLLIVILFFAFSKKQWQNEKQLIDESNKNIKNYIDNECKKIVDKQFAINDELKKEIKFLLDNLSKKTQQIVKLERNRKTTQNNDEQQLNDVGTQTEDYNKIPKEMTDGIFMRLRSNDKIFH